MCRFNRASIGAIVLDTPVRKGVDSPIILLIDHGTVHSFSLVAQ